MEITDKIMQAPSTVTLDSAKKKLPLNRYIDHTLLKPYATEADFQKLVGEAIKYNFASVCVAPYIAIGVHRALENHPTINSCTVVGFPHGNLPGIVKAQQIHYFVKAGIREIDFVINYGLLKSGLYDAVVAEIKQLNQLCKQSDVITKCIVETCYLTEDEKIFLYKVLSEDTTVDFIKTSTGYGSEGAQLVDVMNWNARRQSEQEARKRESSDLLILHEEPAEERVLKIKAAGGIKDLRTALKFIQCGADRLGTGASVKIMEEYNAIFGALPEGEEAG